MVPLFLLGQSNRYSFTQVYNSTASMVRIQLTDCNNRNTTQILPPKDNCLIPTPHGKNTVQLVGDNGRAIATYTLDSDFSHVHHLRLNMNILVVVVKNETFDFRRGSWDYSLNNYNGYGKSFHFLN